MLPIYFYVFDHSLEYDWPLRGQTLRENWLSFPSSYQLPGDPSLGVQFHVYLVSLCWDLVWLELVQVLCMLSNHYESIVMHNWPKVSRKYCSNPTTSISYFSAPLSTRMAEPWKEVMWRRWNFQSFLFSAIWSVIGSCVNHNLLQNR